MILGAFRCLLDGCQIVVSSAAQRDKPEIDLYMPCPFHVLKFLYCPAYLYFIAPSPISIPRASHNKQQHEQGKRQEEWMAHQHSSPPRVGDACPWGS